MPLGQRVHALLPEPAAGFCSRKPPRIVTEARLFDVASDPFVKIIGRGMGCPRHCHIFLVIWRTPPSPVMDHLMQDAGGKRSTYASATGIFAQGDNSSARPASAIVIAGIALDCDRIEVDLLIKSVRCGIPNYLIIEFYVLTT